MHPQPANQFTLPDEGSVGYEQLTLSHDHDGSDVVEKLWVKRVPELNGEMIGKATVSRNRVDRIQVGVEFTREGSARFAEVSRMLADERKRTGRPRRLAIVIDGEVFSAPVLHDEISGGRIEITGSFTEREAQELADLLNNPWQVRLRIVEERQFGAESQSRKPDAED